MKDKAQNMSGAGLMVVATLCLSLLLSLGTVCWMAANSLEIPEVLDRLLQGLLIGVPALLAKTYRDAKQQDVNVVNSAADPVPVETEALLEDPSPRRRSER